MVVHIVIETSKENYDKVVAKIREIEKEVGDKPLVGLSSLCEPEPTTKLEQVTLSFLTR